MQGGPTKNDALDFLAGGGEMGKLIREMDWARTPLGPIEAWPQSLKTTVSLCLNSNFPIALAWGPQRTQIYNDGYWPICGAKHPHSMGQDFRECWFSAWPVIGEAFDTATGGQSAFLVNQRMFLDRNGYLEETFFTFSFSPIRDESGGVGGLFHPVTELTQQSLSERRLKVLRDLADHTAEAKTVADACAAMAEVFKAYDLDLPFALLYLLDAEGKNPQLCAGTGLEAVSADAWPFDAVLAERQVIELDDVAARLPGVACGPYPEAPKAAFVMPILLSGLQHPFAVLVAGVSSRRALDGPYRTFYLLLREAVGNALTNARAYEEERRRAEALAAIDRAKTAFFSNVSHEFRTPLTLMLGPLEDELRENPRERIELAHRNGLRLLKLVNTLLDFSRIEAGRAQASYVPTDLAALTAELASSFRSAMEKAGLAFEVECPPLAAQAYVDRDMWEKIVLNLLSNAFKFTFEGGVALSLRESGGEIILEVKDSGTGIPAAELPHVFERFRRVEGAKSRTHEGTGIGLALVQELAKLHGGTVGVESEEGRGSTFRVTIPAGSAHLPAERIGAGRTLASTSLGADAFVEEALRWLPDAKAPEAVPAGNRRARIVWADDNADMREYVRHLLAPHYEVEAVADGAAALAAVQAARPDAVLTDVMMPGIDGLELVRRLRADPATETLPVLVLSARAGEESRIEGLDAGADDYLYKPFSARELLARVGALVRGAELREQHARIEQALTESERKLQTLIGNLPGMVYRCPTVAPWPLTFASEGVAELTGYPASAFMGRQVAWADLMNVDDVAAVAKEIEGALAERRRFELSYRIRHRDGSERWMLDRGRAVYDERTGEAVAFEGFVLDLTRQREAEAALREADRRKDEFLATLAHELRNPLAPLTNALQLLQRPDAQPEWIATIHAMMERQLGHLVRLVDDLLELSRISRGALELRRERVAVVAVIQNAVDTSRPLIEAAKHRLTVEYPEEALWLDGDPVRLAQILANLLNNAAKYTDPGGAITVAAGREGDEAVISVRDNGTGIAVDALPHVFDMFRREERTRRRGQEGLGIGLALARRLAEMHGGRLDGESEGPGRGATFTLRLPAAAALAPAQAPEQARLGEPLRQRILVVDDNSDAAQSLGMVLQALGAEVRIVHDGKRALESFVDYDPQVVLLDIGMPGMDGYEVARSIRVRYPERRTTLVALTGWGQEEDRRRARNAGFDHHLVKPADLGALQSLFSSL